MFLRYKIFWTDIYDINGAILFFTTLTTSGLSATLGMSKFLKLGPCRLLPKNGWCGGFPWLMLSIASALAIKMLIFAIFLPIIAEGNYLGIISGWIFIYILPLLFVCKKNFIHILIMHSTIITIHVLILFQTLAVNIIAAGPKNTWQIFIKYPALILISVFSFWTIGPISPSPKKKWCKIPLKSQYLGVSFWHTWINILLVIVTLSFLYTSFYLELNHYYSRDLYYSQISFVFKLIAVLFALGAALPILILQKLKCKCCCNCSQISTLFTVLNIENVDRLTSIYEILNDYVESDVEINVISN